MISSIDRLDAGQDRARDRLHLSILDWHAQSVELLIDEADASGLFELEGMYCARLEVGLMCWA